MNLMSNMKDEQLGVALLYNFTLGYGLVDLELYDLVLPLLYNDTFREEVLSASSLEEAINQSSTKNKHFKSEVLKALESYKEMTNNALALGMIQGYIAYVKVEGVNKGKALESAILSVNEAKHLASLLKGYTKEKVIHLLKASECSIVVLQRDSVGLDVSLDELESLGNVTYYSNTLPDEIKPRIKEADIVITNKNVIGKEELEGSKVKLITLTATGFNNIDVEYCKAHDIEVRNVKDYSTYTVAQHTLTLALSLLEHLPVYDRYVKSGTYSIEGNFSYFNEVFHDLSSLRWGVVGLGNIGRKVADTAAFLGCDVVYYSTSGAAPQEGYHQVDLDTLLKTSDIISIHCPFNKQTENLFDVVAIAKMKSSAILINVARGHIVEEEALYNAIKLHKLSGVGLDVYDSEPLPADSPVLKLKDYDNVILTPHIAWASLESRIKCVDEVVNNIRSYLQGEKRNNVF